PRREWPQAIGTKQQTPGSRLKSIAGMTILVCPGSKHCRDDDIDVSRLKITAGMMSFLIF
ncbi:MAG: hypothetical protein WBG74_02910, partial [Shewanella sp.]|uniref:hypothetical protein n=1 Tax=Shewanella sp. TaxID=50422 RepID=UPI003C781ECD